MNPECNHLYCRAQTATICLDDLKAKNERLESKNKILREGLKQIVPNKSGEHFTVSEMMLIARETLAAAEKVK